MKIAYLNTSYNQNSTTGGATHIREFIDEVSASGHRIFASQYNQHPKVTQIEDSVFLRLRTIIKCDVIYTRYSGKLTNSMLFNKFPLRQLTQNSLNIWEFNALPVYAITKGKGRCEVQRQNDLLRKEAEVSDLAVCVSTTMAAYVDDVLHWRKILVVPNGSNPEHFKPGLPHPERMSYFKNSFNIVWMGSLSHEWSNIDLLTKTTKTLWALGYKEIFFHLIGSFPSWLSETLPPNAYLYGKQPYDKLPNWLSAMDVGLNLYKENQNDYGSPIKIFDYMANGLGVISTQQPQVYEILDEIGFADFVLQLDGPQELLEKILLLYENEDLLQDYKKKARELIVNKYNWKNGVNKILTEIKVLLNEKK